MACSSIMCGPCGSIGGGKDGSTLRRRNECTIYVVNSLDIISETRSPGGPCGSIGGGKDDSTITYRHKCTTSVGDSIEMV